MSTGLAAAVAQQRAQTPYEKFRNKLMSIKPELGPLVGANNVDRFVRVALNAVQANPALLEADGRSLLNSCMKAATDNLLPDGREAVFNIYNTKIKQPDGSEWWVPTVQYLPMVGGLIKKLYESGHVTFVDGVAVNEKDHFVYQRGDEPKIEHKPFGGADPGPIVAAYAIVKLTNGEIKREVMFKRDIDKVRAVAKTDKGWKEWEDQFAIKSVLKRAYKQLPSSEEIESIINSDNVAMGFTGADIQLLPEVAGGEAPPKMNINTEQREPAKNENLDQQQDDSLKNVERRPANDTVDKGTGEIKPGPAGETKDMLNGVPAAQAGGELTWAQKIVRAMENSATIDTLEVAYDLRRDPDHTASAEENAEFDKVYQQRRLDLAPKPSKKK